MAFTPNKTILTIPPRNWMATMLGVITLLCASGFYASIALTRMQFAADFNGPELGEAALDWSFPPALACTVVSLILVGWRRSGMALLSLGCYGFFFAFNIGLGLFGV